MIVTLDVVDGPERGRSFHFSDLDSFLVGRSLKAHLRLDPVADPYISRTHCLIEVRPPRCILTDLGSTNGTRVNERSVRNVEVGHGDIIRVGHTAIRVGVKGLSRPDETAQEVEVSTAPEIISAGVSVQPSDRRRVSAASEEPCCEICGRGMGQQAEDDGMSRSFQEALYICAPCAVQKRAPDLAQKRLGDYDLLAEIGRGGMGVVYKAVHRATARVCAIKQLLPESARDERARRRFEREIDIQKTVEHPHLVRVWSHERGEGESLYFVTEYMPGGDLEHYATRVVGGPVEPRIACVLIRQILSGLHELHSRGMIHRDLKPSNFLLSRQANDTACLAKISDYGLAKCFEEAGNSVFAYTNAGYVAGSMLFMAPEQITNFRFVRPPADVYSVGVSLYYLLSATYTVDFLTPVDGGRRRHPVEMVVEDPPVPLLERNPRIPVQVAEIVDQAVRKDPEQRFQTARELLVALETASRELGWMGSP